MAAITTDTTSSVLARHLEAIFTRDVDKIMADYAADAVLFTPTATFRGLDQVRGFFTQALNIFTPEVLATMQLSRQDVDGEFAYIFWSAGATVPLGSDTFYIHAGKIVMQSFAGQFIV